MTHATVIAPAEVASALRLVDVRDAASLAAGRAAVAGRVPIEDRIGQGRTPVGDFASAAFRADAFRKLGVSAGSVAGVYDDGRLTEAASVRLIRQCFGLPTAILNGGRPAVKAAGLPSACPDPRAPTLKPACGRVRMMDRTGHKAALETETVLDTRTRAEHLGRAPKSSPRGGHLPGADLLPRAELPDCTRLRAPDELRAVLTSTGQTPGRHPITTHCRRDILPSWSMTSAAPTGPATKAAHL